MATTYTVTNSFTAGTTAVASQVNQNFTDILTAINSYDASNLASGTVPLARISGLTTTQFAANVVDTDDTLAADSDTRIPSQAAVKDYVVNTIQAAVGATTMTPLSYAAEESVTFPNGLILKQGNAAYSGSNLTVTFGTAFPTECTRVIVSLNDSAWGNHYAPVSISKSATNFVVSMGNSTSISIDWMAWGY